MLTIVTLDRSFGPSFLFIFEKVLFAENLEDAQTIQLASPVW